MPCKDRVSSQDEIRLDATSILEWRVEEPGAGHRYWIDALRCDRLEGGAPTKCANNTSSKQGH